MIFRYPFNNFPFYYNNYNSYKRQPVLSTHKPSITHIQENVNQNTDKKNPSNSKDEKEEYFFDLFGIRLYFDDILLICLIFFLYNEGVKDEGLFMALILLLLT